MDGKFVKLTTKMENNYNKYWANYEKINAVNEKQDLRYLQAVDLELKEGYNTIYGIEEILKLFDRSDLLSGQDLDRKIIMRKEFEKVHDDHDKMVKIFNTMKKYFHKVLPKLVADEDKFIKTREALENWYNDNENENKHLYEEIDKGQARLNFLNKHHLSHGLDVFKTANWKPKSKKTTREKFDSMCKEGKWTCTDWNLLKPRTWSLSQLKNNFEKCLEHSLGYSFLDIEGGECRKWCKQTIGSDFDWLNLYRSDNNNKNELEFIEDDSLSLVKPKKNKKKLVIIQS